MHLEVSTVSSELLVPFYLMSSYLYHCKNCQVLSDEQYDQICKRLDTEYDFINHRHLKLVDRSALAAGTGFYLKENDLPAIVKHSARTWYTEAGGEWFPIEPPRLAEPKTPLAKSVENFFDC